MSKKNDAEHIEARSDLKTARTTIEGTAQLYEAGGQLRLIPRPSSHKNDPLNFSPMKKGLAIFSVCFFGAIAIAMQQMMAGLLPVFMLEYAGVDPKALNEPDGLAGILATAFRGSQGGAMPTGMTPGGGIDTEFGGNHPTVRALEDNPPITPVPTSTPTVLFSSGILTAGFSPSGIPIDALPSGGLPSAHATGPMPSHAPNDSDGNYPSHSGGGWPSGGGGNPLEALSKLPGAEPLSRVNLIISLPVLVVGLANYILVPASTAFGRRAVMIFCVVIATFATAWSGWSTSLSSHIASRCVQAFGPGAVESLIPLVVQDMTFVHQRSSAIALIWASQGIITVSLGIGSSHIVAKMGWKWLYLIGAIITGISAICVILFLPETRWQRDPVSLRGEAPDYELQNIPSQVTENTNGKPTFWVEYGVCSGGIKIRDGLVSFIEIVKTLVFPIVAYLILLNAAFIGISLGSNTTMSTVLLSPPYSWRFDSIGLVVIAPTVASIFVMFFGGFLSDKLVNRLAKRNGGKREAEMNLWNLGFPLIVGIFGCILYGIGGEYVNKVHWIAIVFATGLMIFSFLTVNIVASVVAFESFPRLAGPVLVNVASFRNIVGFAFTYGIPDWVAARGYMGAFGIFAGVIGFLSLFLPIFFLYGRRLREWSSAFSKEVTYSL